MNAAKKTHFEDQSNFLLSSELPDSGGLYNQHAAMSQEEIDHTSSTTLGANSSTSDSCWAARSWENTGSGGGSIDGDYSGGRIDWDIKASWDWDNAMYFSGKGSEKKGDWAAETGEVFLQNGGKENPFPVSTSSSGIPGLAATRNAETGVVCSSNQKKQPTDLQIQAFKLSGQATQGEAMSQKGLNSIDLSGIETEEKSEKRTKSSIPAQQMCDKKDSSEHQQKKLFLGLGGNWEQKEKTSSSNEGLESGKAVVGETSIGLKLGKRTYFEDTSAVASSKSPVCSSISSPSSTKKRASAPSMQVPRCQVEGCQTDLSTAKDYHRRHKVCAMHSKAPKVMAAGLEQRFCQQCSRFHVLSEFDEGKRSCRRRLEGHNQRRRKPQPDPLIAASMAHHVSAFHDLTDDRRIFTGLGDRHSYLQPSRSMLLPFEDPDEKFRSWSRYGHLNENSSLLVPNSDRQLLVPNQRLLMLWQNPKTTHYSSNSMNGHGLHNFIHGSSGHGAQAHTSSSSRSGVLSGLESTQVSQGLTPLTDSGCALSLLSSQWGSRSQDQGSIAGGVPKSNGAMEQYVVDRVPMAQHFLDGHGNQVYGVTDKLNPIVSQGHAIPIDSGSSYVSGLGNIVGNFDSHCTFSLLQANHLRGLPDVARPTIDLMQVTPSSQQQHSHHHRHHQHHHTPPQVTSAQSAASQFSDYALRYESPLFDTQQMM